MYSSSSFITLNIVQLYYVDHYDEQLSRYEFTKRCKYFEHVYVESGVTIIDSIPRQTINIRFFHRIPISFEISLEASIDRYSLEWKQNGIAKLKFKIHIRQRQSRANLCPEKIETLVRW